MPMSLAMSCLPVTPQSHSTCDMWHVYTGSSPFPSSFFVEFEETYTSEMREAKPTLVSQMTFVTLLPCIIHYVCHVMCKVEHDASPHPPPPPWQSRVHDGAMTTACVMSSAQLQTTGGIIKILKCIECVWLLVYLMLTVYVQYLLCQNASLRKSFSGDGFSVSTRLWTEHELLFNVVWKLS